MRHAFCVLQNRTTVPDIYGSYAGRRLKKGVLIAVCMILTIKKRKDEEDEESSKQEIREDKEEKEEENDRKRSKLLGLLPSIGPIIAFILTEDMRLPMILVDRWTLLMLILLAVTILLAYFTRHKDNDDEEDDEGNELKTEMAS